MTTSTNNSNRQYGPVPMSFVSSLGYMTRFGTLLYLCGAAILAGIWTVIPTSFLPWGAHKENLLNYVSHCSFAPASTLILWITASLIVLKYLKREYIFPSDHVIIGIVTLGFLIGLVNGITILTFLVGLVGVGLGILLGTIMRSTTGIRGKN